jgi:hypothetical protein
VLLFLKALGFIFPVTLAEQEFSGWTLMQLENDVAL